MLSIKGGKLHPRVHNGVDSGLCYGIDADGLYLGVVPHAIAAAEVSAPPPRLGRWRWGDGRWQPYYSPEEQAREIDRQRDAELDAGFAWSARAWPADAAFQSIVSTHVAMFSDGVLPGAATVAVRAKDRVVYQLSRAELRELVSTMAAFVADVYQRSWAAKAAISR